MGKRYGQLSLTERIEIYRLHEAGKSPAEIARELDRHRSTVGRELKRNGRRTKIWQGGYDPVRAHGLAERRRRWDGRFKLARQPDLRKKVRNRLAMGWSPEQIAGRLTREEGRTLISHESIYRFIYHRSNQKDYWHRLLPRRKSKRGRLRQHGGSSVTRIPHRQPITQRPSDVANRSTAGHWEGDTMLFSRYGQNLLVAHERRSRMTLVVKPPNRRADTIAAHLLEMFEPLPRRMCRTISFDNGTEFTLHGRLTSRLRMETYFCDPHSPWQKGGVENAIGRLRRVLPRKTDLSLLSERQLKRLVRAHNDTPRKCLDFKTPAEIFSELQSTVALQP
jgi:IS30 family transposase